MTTGAHSVWSARRDGESLRKVGDDLRMTPVTTMGKGGAQIVFGGKTHGNCREHRRHQFGDSRPSLHSQ